MICQTAASSEDGPRLERDLVLVEGAALPDEPDLGPEPREHVLLGGNSIGKFGLSFSLKNGLRFHLDSATCGNY